MDGSIAHSGPVEQSTKEPRPVQPTQDITTSTSSTTEVDDNEDLFDETPTPNPLGSTIEAKRSLSPIINDSAHALSTHGVSLPGLGSTEKSHIPNATIPDVHQEEKDEGLSEAVDQIEIQDTNKEESLPDADVPPVNGTHSNFKDTNGTSNRGVDLQSSGVTADSTENRSVAVDKDRDSKHAKSGVDREFLEAATANKGDKDAEWQYDSSDAPSSDSSSDSSSSSGDSDEEYTFLDPAEQARLLMEAGSDDEDDDGGPGPKSEKDNTKLQPRTANEQIDITVEKPDIIVTPEMEIRELGSVENIVHNFILIKGSISGETQVLESGSVVCLADRTVIGSIYEPLGRVEEPRYSVAFSFPSDIEACGITQSTKIFYVVQHSNYVFTQPLKLMKGSDASNVHDEEVNENEAEFSDDEAEAEFNRKLKQEKLAKRGIVPGSSRHSKRPRQRPAAESEYPDAPMRYEDGDNEDDDGMYKPLARPENLHQMSGMEGQPPLRPPLFSGDHSDIRQGRGNHSTGRGGGRDRGDRRQSRGDMRGGRAGFRPAHPRPNQSPPSAGQGMYPRFSGHDEGVQSDYQNSGNSPGVAPPPPIPGQYQHPPAYPQFQTPPNPQQLAQWYNGALTTAWNQGNPQYPPGPPMHTNQTNLPPGAFMNPAFFQNQANSGYSAAGANGQHQQHQTPSNGSSWNQPPQPYQHQASRGGQPSNGEYDPSRPWMN